MKADLEKRRIFLGVRGFLRTGGELAGQADAYCPDRSEAGYYDPCSSSFFVSYAPESPRYRRLDVNAVERAVAESGIIPALELRANEREIAAKGAWRQEYEQAFTDADTLAKIQAFEDKYRQNDPLALAPKLRDRLVDIEEQQLATSTSREQLMAFVSTYRDDDPASLVPKARAQLATLDKKLTKESELKSLLSGIASCRSMMRYATQQLADENAVGAISGAVNLRNLHNAGQALVSCKRQIPVLYAQYKAQGGTRSLESIR